MYFVGLGVLLLVMKVAHFGPVGAWAWWVVLAPFGLAVAWWTFSDATGRSKRLAMRAMDDKRAARRQEQMESLGTAPKRKR